MLVAEIGNVELARGGQTGDLALRAEVLASTADVDRHQWDALVSDHDFFNSWGWLASLDHALGDTPLLTVRGPTGLLTGCALWDGERTSGLFCAAELFANIPGPWERDFLWLGGRRSTHNEIACVSGHRKAAALKHLLHAAVDRAAAQDRAGIVVPYVPLPTALELVGSLPNAALVLHTAEAATPVPHGGLPEMLASWRTHDRTCAHAEIAAFERKGNRIEWRPIDDELEAVAAHLIAQNRERHGSAPSDEWMRRMLAGQRKSGVIDSAIAAVAMRGDEIVGLTLFYRFGRSLHARYFGSNYAIADKDFRYFCLCYYAPLDYAVAQGFSEVRLSIAALQAKAKRGAQLEPLAAVVALSDGSRLDQDAVTLHNHTLVQEFRREFQSHLSPEWNLFDVETY
jgi:hypothetical protein